MRSDIELDIKRAVITRPSDEDKKVPVQQVTYNGKIVDTEVFFPYGMHANLPVSSPTSSGFVSYGLLLPINGEEDVSVGLFSAPTHRPTRLEEGELCFYHPFTQTYIQFKNNGNLEIETQGEEGTADITIKKDMNITIGGQSTVIILGNSTVDIVGNSNVDILGNSTVDIFGNSIVDIEVDSTISIGGKADVTITGDSVVDMFGNATIDVTGTATVIAPTTNWTGDINLTGNIDITGTSTATDHVSNGISGNSHTHGGVQSGSSNTDGPQ